MYDLLHCKQLRVELRGCLGRFWTVWHFTGHHSPAQRDSSSAAEIQKIQTAHGRQGNTKELSKIDQTWWAQAEILKKATL